MSLRFRGRVSLFALCALIGLCASARATIIYSANTPRYYLPSDPNPLYYNVGPFSGAGRILFDDVPILIGSTVNPNIDVTQVTFDISRKANALPMTVTAYWAPLMLDIDQDGGPDDGPNDDPGAPVLIGSMNLMQNGATHSRQTITFGDGVNLLFNTGVLNQAQAAGYGMFAIGLKFSDPSDQQGWTVGLHNDNSDLLWDYFNDTDFDEFTYNTDGNGQDIIGTHMMSVSGTLVPEPGSLCLMLGAVAWLSRSRRRH